MTLLEIVLVLTALPFVTYFCVKFGVYAWLRARQLFDETEKGDRK